ncbi:hypothetical protein HMPREF9248_0330, partial [Fannyhessea vaginae PB189-T1-4]
MCATILQPPIVVYNGVLHISSRKACCMPRRKPAQNATYEAAQASLTKKV